MADTINQRKTIDPNTTIPPSTFAHLVVKTKNLDSTLDWFEKVIGTKVVFRNNVICFTTYDEEHHRIAFIQLPPEAPLDHGTGTIDHVAYSYNDLGELLSNYYRLKTLGIEPVRTINHGPTISFYYRDPNGVKLELQVDNFATKEEANVFFNSSAFAENPIGVIVDPDKLRADWEAGVAWERIRERPPIPEGMTIADMRKERA